jgi:outer membrane protein assembly factor BamA
VQKYLFILAFILSCSAFAQKAVNFHIHHQRGAQQTHKDIVGSLDSIAFTDYIKTLVLNYNEAGYLAARIDSVFTQQDTTYLFIDIGEQYRWVRLSKGNMMQEAITAAGFRVNEFDGKVFSPVEYTRRINRIIQYFECIGYPFASIVLDSIVIDSNTISAAINLTLHDFIVYDSIEIIGDANIKKWFVHRYLSMKLGSPYNEQHVKRIDARINQLPYLTSSRNAAMYFYGNKAKPIVFIENRRANNFDGVLGFAPNNQQAIAGGNNLLITGEGNLKLQNLFATGKYLEINFRSFLGNSQELRLRTAYPYILKSNIGIDYDLRLLRQDTSFLDVRNTVGIQYRFAGEDQIRFFYGVEQTTLISVDTNRIKALRTLPDISDLVNYQYGTSGKMVRYDYLINPRKGFGFDVSASIGSKQIRRNPTIDAIRLSTPEGGQFGVYDSVPLRMIQYAIQGSADVFIPIISNFVARTQIMGAHLQAPRLFLSELYRIGGIRTLKGFDEQAIFASTYLILNAEVRYLLQKNAHALLFWNGAYYENAASPQRPTDTPFGFGAGVNFETGAGIFSLYYALGKEQQNPIEFRRAKVHFGLINYF